MLVAVDEAPGSPLAVLATPTTLEADASSATLIATYPAASLGLPEIP